MSTSRKIFWIDDDGRRKRTADDIGADFINVNEEDLGETVDELLKRPQPSLIVLDHILDKTSGTNPFFKKGSTIAEAIKEKWSTCPVVGVTNADIDTIDLHTTGLRRPVRVFAFQRIHRDNRGYASGFCDHRACQCAWAKRLIKFIEATR